jgi:hypothetical protein
MSRRLVFLESPLAGDVERNVAYAKECMRDSIARGEAPFASHLLYAQAGILNDTNDMDREIGLECGLAWAEKAETTVVYADYGESPGMTRGIYAAQARGRPIEYRYIRNKVP